MDTSTRELIETCGGFRASVHGLVSVSRAFWTICSAETAGEGAKKKDFYRRIPRTELRRAFVAALERPEMEGTFEALAKRMLDLRICWEKDGELTVRRSVANPLDFVRLMLRDARPDHDIKYFVMENIRRYYRFGQSAAVAHQFHTLAAALNQMLDNRSSHRVGPRRSQAPESKADAAAGLDHAVKNQAPEGNSHSLRGEVLPRLDNVLNRDFAIPMRLRDAFLESCRVVNHVRLSDKIGCIEVSPLDPEYLMSRLFGLPTGIKGLDDLFGGGGLMLVETAEPLVRDQIGGRAVVTLGPFGTGKSLLSLQMAVEVARKGGVAWYMPLEQTAEECLYVLESMGALADDAPFQVGTTVPRAMELLRSRDPERGALILLRSIKHNFADFLAAFEENVRLMEQYSLRLIVVDPISAMSQSGAAELTEKRARMLEMFEKLKQTGTNIWLVAEEATTPDETRYEQNIADTVIHLCYENRHGYSQRYLEITKSRLQREQRGRHAFAVGPGRGITIYPAPAAFRSRIKSRSVRPPEKKIRFGVPSLDAILGDGGLYAGDIIVLQGPSGCSKTPVGLSFLLGSDWDSSRGEKDSSRGEKDSTHSLLVSARDNEETIRHILRQLLAMPNHGAAAGAPRKPEHVRVAVMEGGYVKPGYILQQIESEFLTARLNLATIGRVMIDNVAHWEFSCPYVREDKTFGDTLIDLLRRHRVTTVLSCGEPDSESVLQRSIMDSADCLIQFERIEFRGSTRVIVRVVKTRDMSHRREAFELIASPHNLEIRAASSLLRVGRGGTVSPAKVRLFMHSESDAQTAYNKTLVSAVRAVLSRDAEAESENPIHSNRALALGSASAVDELQVIQLDEFQLPSTRAASSELCSFPVSAWNDGEWSDVIPRLQQRVRMASGIMALPYYENVALLAHRSDVDQRCLQSWEELSRECARWEKDRPSTTDVFFDFPAVSSENYNSLFLEILLWLGGPPRRNEHGAGERCDLRDWLTSEAACEALLLMHRLCHRAFIARQEPASDDICRASPFPINKGAQVWRHWYSTLHQMLSCMTAAERADVMVTTLPGEISVAGEWYLGVPSYSAAPDVALQIIQLFTSHEAEMDRVKHGVGLPVRASFYDAAGGAALSPSPLFAMDAAKLFRVVKNAFQRSEFGCYQRQASTWSMHIQGVLALAESDEQALRRAIREKTHGLERRLAFLGPTACSRCAVPAAGSSKAAAAHLTSSASSESA